MSAHSHTQAPRAEPPAGPKERETTANAAGVTLASTIAYSAAGSTRVDTCAETVANSPGEVDPACVEGSDLSGNSPEATFIYVGPVAAAKQRVSRLEALKSLSLIDLRARSGASDIKAASSRATSSVSRRVINPATHKRCTDQYGTPW